jgi:hypothetical protein
MSVPSDDPILPDIALFRTFLPDFVFFALTGPTTPLFYGRVMVWRFGKRDGRIGMAAEPSFCCHAYS